MAHGSKRWIVTYDGTLKRSNDRTNKDYYRDLKWWDSGSWGYYSRKRKKQHCPQCKYIRKLMHKDVAFRHYHWRNYLCFKCERKEEVQNKMPWIRWNTYSEQQKEYRKTVRNIMQRAKFDVDMDEYEDIPIFKYDAWRDY